MKFKKGLKTLGLIAAAATLYCGTATAADYNVNIYGASAQYLFWNDAADDFLLDTTNGPGCSTAVQAEHTNSDGKKKHGITKGTKGADTYYIRYTSKASYDGIYSCYGESSVPGGQPSCSAQGTRYREMADEANTNWTTGVVSALACKKVTVGASDVAGSTFGQTSEGEKAGHLGGGWISRTVSSIDTDAEGLTKYYRPVIVPFGFFRNDVALPTVTNLTRLQALMVFSGSAFYWDDFGSTYPGKDVIACLRHAGSGTHATLNAAVMRGDWPIATLEDAPYILFNDGSSDMMKCIDQNGGESTATAGAVGYADSDYCAASPSKCTNVDSMTYNGAQPVKENITNGVYSFWSHQYLFECLGLTQAEKDLVKDLYDFAKLPANLPAAKASYWATESELNVTKANDFSMPTF